LGFEKQLEKNMENTSSNRLSWIPILLIIFNFTANLSNDIYLPSLPRLIQVFHTSANTVQLTMTIWFAGVAIPQLFFGPLTEKYGRRPILMWGGVCFVISSLLCCVASSIHMLLIARFFQGVGVCSLNVTSFSILSDLYAYKQRIKIMTQISICGTLAPLIGPIIGGYILTLLGWRENFMLIFSLGLISLIGLKLSLPETNLELNTEATKLKRVAANYLSLLKTHGFLTHLIPYCLMLGGLFI
jgi:DHA1 family bicyclomycin/chloramphenicol resistance-like MFS transporter